MSRGIASSLCGFALIAALAGCGVDEPSAPAVKFSPAQRDRIAIERTALTWAAERDCSLISVAYAIRLGDGSESNGRAVCDSQYASVSSRPGYLFFGVTISGDTAAGIVHTPAGREVSYPLVRDGAGRWRIDGDPATGCQQAGETPSGSLELCPERSPGPGFFVVANPHGSRDVLHVLRPFRAGASAPPVGHWAWAAASPDGKTILAQWSGECEIPYVYLLPAEGGRPRLATGQPTADAAPESLALGWTTDGRAIVFIPREPGCGGGEGAGLYLISPAGKRTLLAPATGFEPPAHLKRSVRARRVASLRAAIR